MEIGDRILTARVRLAGRPVQKSVDARSAGYRIGALAADEPDVRRHAGGIDSVVAVQSIDDGRRAALMPRLPMPDSSLMVLPVALSTTTSNGRALVRPPLVVSVTVTVSA